MFISDLPPELLLEIFAHLPHLKSLIAAQGVSRDWRRLLPLSNIRPARRALLELYMHAVNSPSFLATRATILPHVVPFDREAYLENLCYTPDTLPEQFRLWILEWPARATIGRLWPGVEGDEGLRQRFPGKNFLSIPLYSDRTYELFTNCMMADFDVYIASKPWSSESPARFAVVTVLPIWRPLGSPREEADYDQDYMLVQVHAPVDLRPMAMVYDGLHMEEVRQDLLGTMYTYNAYHSITSFGVEEADGIKRSRKRVGWVDYLRALLDKEDARLPA
ncbi:hypothetical protein PLICRDRAFT_426471 [Plicaturopsis crispa FD-325 SS-3]|nr:hypothetical protein PLICRDRAFT_426471 [Plicaturopsis crispa FD-325 SS-3]